jgi:photosystem II stability/assembly factor-like uncharacterized protein
LPSGTTNGLREIAFTNDSTAFIVGSTGTILKTNNAGLSWGALNSNTTTN